jgi:phage/plasmid-associated DNA primase
MANVSNIKLPKIDRERFAKNPDEIINYLVALEGVLKYMFGNVDDENMTDKALEQFKTPDGVLTQSNATNFLDQYYKLTDEVLTKNNATDFLDAYYAPAVPQG